uniref:AN1-type domain-containing protein n=1 Tax=Chromera velia CCMP2878 TaxID=1169474 RepID=A0A0G4IAY1_9ALVE|eukprot:Cvel_12710.t1-p1 / transcript=Cvel_12710.t1 / gene=Cvel_12710 / organism=Chromera_velia_CCMP2878 / gene_product=Zinc finger AN1 domain-containing stress-associated, putative / transcript_product=Zinc finger AN1 domain-containing stress-associated, putative / location=Cvel_scaffold843:27170-29760(+) / protein_length=258 / sequence_SO=supercontig / SO=protein_coding / is_pseudo=false
MSTTCSACSTRITLVQSVIKCRCGEAFCDRHRTPSAHSCSFDYETHGKERLRKELKTGTESSRPTARGDGIAGSSSSSSSSSSYEAAWKNYEQSHASRNVRICHSIGLLILLWYAFWSLVGFSLRPLLWGVLLSLVCAKGSHFLFVESAREDFEGIQLVPIRLRHWLGLQVSDNSRAKEVHWCRGCLWSLGETVKAPLVMLQVENEGLLENLCNIITAGGTNCLTGQLKPPTQTANRKRSWTHLWNVLSNFFSKSMAR